MTTLWQDDARYGFDETLHRFPELLQRASSLQTTQANVPLAIKAAVIGFALHQDILSWSREEYDYVNGFLTEDHRMVDFNRVEGCEEGFAAFMCLCLGTLCGRHVSGDIDLDGVARGEWLLLTFLSTRNEAICRKYTEFRDEPPGANGQDIPSSGS